LYQTRELGIPLDGSRSSRDTQRGANAISGLAERTDHSFVPLIKIKPRGSEEKV